MIIASNLTKVYGGQTKAVDMLELRILEGEIYGLLGPNGAGKTTTMGMLTGRVIPTEGSVEVAGIDVSRRPSEAKQVIGIVTQHNTLDRALTVRENLIFHGRYFGMGKRGARAISDELLERFNLTDRADAQAEELSGGMAQRVMLARAIMHRPQVLFLDEPTTGLDPQSRIALWEILQELNEMGQTIVLTTHYMEEADALSDRVAIIDHGKVLALDTPEALKASMSGNMEVRLKVDGDVAGFAEHMKKLPGVTGVVATDDVVRVSLTQTEGVLPKVMAHAAEGGFTITDFSAVRPNLETVFLELTGRALRE